MHKIEIQNTKVVIEIPESGYEFTPKQFQDFAALVFLYVTKQISYSELLVKLVYKMGGITRTAKPNLLDPEYYQLLENIAQLTKLVEPYFNTQKKEGKEVKVIDPVFIQQKIPVLKIGRTKLYGPADALSDTVFSEYIQVLNYLKEVSTNEIESLDKLIALLYRPKKWLSKTRKKYQQEDPYFNSRVALIKKLPIGIKYAIYLYVASSQYFITTSDSLDVGGGNNIDLTVIFNKDNSKKSSSNSLGMVDVLYSLAETPMFTNIQDVGNTNTYDVLVLLAKKTIDNKKRKANVKHK